MLMRAAVDIAARPAFSPVFGRGCRALPPATTSPRTDEAGWGVSERFLW